MLKKSFVIYPEFKYSAGYYEKLRSKQKYGSERVQSHYSNKQNQQNNRKRRNSYTGVGDTDFSMFAMENLHIHNGNLSAMDCELLKVSNRNGVDNMAGLHEAMRRGGLGEYWSSSRTKDSGWFLLLTKALNTKTELNS